MQPVAADLLRDLAAVLRSEGLRWYVFGAQAVVVHGFVRQTADVDVTVEVASERIGALLAALQSAGFKLRIEEGVDQFVARTRVLPLVHVKTRLPLDLVLAGPGPEQGFLDRAEEVEAGGTRFPVISAEDLVVVKILAGRSKDLDDVRGIVLRQFDTLDLKAVRERLRELEMLLDQADLLPRLEEIVGRIEAERR
ncbi:MAG TPA: nucleotidyltransferase [Myxococcaceae bacterium]|nr:nucleotidyltransferase [Myxococcaceae bacterium]